MPSTSSPTRRWGALAVSPGRLSTKWMLPPHTRPLARTHLCVNLHSLLQSFTKKLESQFMIPGVLPPSSLHPFIPPSRPPLLSHFSCVRCSGLISSVLPLRVRNTEVSLLPVLVARNVICSLYPLVDAPICRLDRANSPPKSAGRVTRSSRCAWRPNEKAPQMLRRSPFN